MNSRRYGSKPTLALWMLVTVADVALLIAATGLLTVVLVLAVLAVVAGGVVVARTWNRPQPEPAKVVARRRA
ncbi:hypothetical protein [Actinoplanes sp. DH11]|uniref:hypothetical protein n=1 Tax=Actinoplanes sp. DH11 TaxID=2857011 RepID=UPI001E5657C5|nr:hypothetical protein [Actinoplanes sp. DH11]